MCVHKIQTTTMSMCNMNINNARSDETTCNITTTRCIKHYIYTLLSLSYLCQGYDIRDHHSPPPSSTNSTQNHHHHLHFKNNPTSIPSCSWFSLFQQWGFCFVGPKINHMFLNVFYTSTQWINTMNQLMVFVNLC